MRNHWCALSLLAIIIVAFALRTVFAYGISADGDFALSGGASAQYHLHIVESILNGSYSLTDSAVNYPVGGLNVYPPLMDYICAGIATVLMGLGMSSAEAASAALAGFNPVIGTLTIIPIYLLGKEMFDRRVGVAAALVFAFLALPISTTVFSSGNAYGLAAFLLAFMSLFVLRMARAVDAEDPSRKAVLINALVAGILLLLAALTWNGFRFVVVLLVVAMVIQIVADRLRGRNFTNVLLGYAITILVGTLASAAYYIPAGLWDSVFSGPCLIAVISVVLSFIFLALRKKPWVVTIPALAVVFIVICAVLALAFPDLYDDLVWGNSIYTSSIMEELASSYVSMSNVSAYYGWLTMWLPICYAIYSTYVYLRRDRSATRLFITVWMFVMFFAVWTTSANAAVVGSVFAVGSAVVIVRVLEAADLREWVSSIRTAGFPGALRKLIKPLPFASVLITALLIVVPNVSYAVDAGISNNSDADYYFTGNTQYTIKTGDSYPVGDLWDEYADVDKSGALATWIDYSYDAVNLGGFDSVTDTLGGGTSAFAQMVLAKGSAGATAAMMLRLMLSNDSLDFSSAFRGYEDVYETVIGYIDDPSAAVDAIAADPDTYGYVGSDLTDENAVYLASLEAITSSMSEVAIMEAYDSVRGITGQSISYFLVDGSMLPLQYGDGSYFSTIAYFAGYTVDSYGAATQFYSYNTYYGTTVYTDAIYDTFLWKAMIGPSATEAGYSSSYSYLVALALSDGSVKAVPGYGLAGYEVVFWQVLYNPDSDASVSDDGWVYMDAYEAMELQAQQGGVINYLASIVMLEYTGLDGDDDVIQGAVTSSGEAVSGATVSVYQYSEAYQQYVLYSQAVTIDGQYAAIVPAGDYLVQISIGDAVVASYVSGSVPATIEIAATSVQGQISVGDDVYDAEDMRLVLTGEASLGDGDNVIDISITDGTFSVSGILPGTYSYVLYNESGDSIGTGSITFAATDNQGVSISPTTRTITVTVNDSLGNSVTSGTVFAVNTTTGAQFSAEVEDGTAVITVVSGTYTLYMGQGYVSLYTSTVSASSSNRTATVTAYDAETVVVSGASSGTILTVTSGTFSTLTYEIDGTIMFDVPVSLGTDKMLYTLYGVGGSGVYHGSYTDEDRYASVTSSVAYIISGTLLDGETGESGSVTFISENDEYYTFATDSDGNYTALLPGGDYIVYADNDSDMVYIGSYSVTGDDDELDLELVDGRRVSYTLRYDRGTSSSNAYVPFVLGVVQFTYEDVEYTLYSMTNTSGVVSFYVPDDIEVTISINNIEGTLNNDAFTCTSLTRTVSSGTSNNSATITIEVYDAEDEDQEYYVNPVEVVIPYDMTLVHYEDDSDVDPSEYSAGETATLRPGQYTVTIDGSTGYYYSGTAYIYPAQNEFYGLDAVAVAIVSVEKADSDSISITSDGGSYYSFSGGYYFEVGYVYYITSTNTTTDDDGETVSTIAYAYLDLTGASAGSEYEIDVTASATSMEVTGHVGVDADGTITVSYQYNGQNITVEFGVTDGSYTLVLPGDVTSVTAEVEVTATIDSETCYYYATGTLSGLSDGVVRNMPVVSGDAPEDEDEAGFEAAITGASFADGVGTVTIRVTNNGTSAMTYIVTAGSALSLSGDAYVNVSAGQTVTKTITVYYNASRVAPGSDGFSVTVSDINGSESQELDILVGDDTSGASDFQVYASGTDGSEYNDRVGAYQYMYAITLVNDNVYSHTVTVNVSSVPSGWSVLLVDESGATVAELGTSFTVYGLQTTVLYVKLMLLEADDDTEVSVPDITATVSVDGSSQRITFSAVDASVTTDSMSTSGTDVYDELSGIPSGVWFLVAVIILLLVAVFWLASKRGVFTRSR